VHILAHDVKKARAGVFEEMPTISDLCSLGRSRGCGVAVARATISGNELDAGVTAQPAVISVAFECPVVATVFGAVAFYLVGHGA
jgi:hypothetical protein